MQGPRCSLGRFQLARPLVGVGPGPRRVGHRVGPATGMNATAAAGLYVLAVVASSIVGRLQGSSGGVDPELFRPQLLLHAAPGDLCGREGRGPGGAGGLPDRSDGGERPVLIAVRRAGASRRLHEEEAREAKLESAASDLRAAVFSAVTHDLKTPITSIKASVDSL